MSQTRKNPAVYAGLSGAFLWACPARAYALALPAELVSSPYAQFGCGFAAGIVLSGAVFAVAHAVRRGAEEAEGAVQSRAAVEAPAAEPSEADATNALGRVRPAHMAAEPRPEATEQAERPRARHMRAAEAPAAEAMAAPAEPKAESPAAPARAVPVIPVASARTRLASLPSTVDTAQDEYDRLADSYVRRRSLRERMAARAAGVASVLSERLGGGDMFDDLPVIERADGTVGDVGTGWWESALSGSIRRVDDIDASLIEEANGSSTVLEPVAYVTPEPTRPSDGALRAAYISKNVAEVKQGIYPEQRSAEDLDGDDLWEMALKAMDERLERERPVFADITPTAAALDEADEVGGSTGPTGFIPFKRPADHPEVVDSSSYVDYLIDEEFSRNPSEAAKESSRDFLRVVQGGSQKSRPMPVLRERRAPQARHMAPSERLPIAKEA